MKMKKWDVCPQCGARRIAICRFCNTIGDNFPLADLDLILPPEHAESVAEQYNTKEDMYDDGESLPAAAQPFLASALGSAFASNIEVKTEENAEENAENPEEHSCSAQDPEKEHSCRCQNQPQPQKRHDFVALSNPLDVDPEIAEDAEEYPLAVMCPCCDELLYPQFLKTCKCGHEFPDGVELESLSDAHFYVPEENEVEDDEEYDEDSDSDDEEEETGDSTHRSARPDTAGCCLMFLGMITTGSLLWFFA